MEDGQQDWAVQLWDNVEKELGLIKSKPEQVLESIKKLDLNDFIELMKELKDDKRFQVYMENREIL